MGYPGDLSDRQWQRLERFFERSDPRGARSKYPKRRVVGAVLFRIEGTIPRARCPGKITESGSRQP